MHWYELLLMIEPNLVIAYQSLAAIHTSVWRLAEAYRRKAYQIQRIFIEQAGDPLRWVLILCVGHRAAMSGSKSFCRPQHAAESSMP